MQTETVARVNADRARTGEPVELGRYETESGERRVLVGRRVEGEVHVYDTPLRAREGEIYLVERRVESLAELVGLVRAYKTEAKRYGRVPMAWTFVDRAIAAKQEDLL